MAFPAPIRHLLLTAAILTASVIQFARGYRPLIVIVSALAFLSSGNLAVYLSGAKERALRRQAKRDFYAGNL